MNALTYEIRSAAAAVAAAKPARPATKGFWHRVWDGLVEARMRQAEREIRQHIISCRLTCWPRTAMSRPTRTRTSSRS
jgi:hypothetical protein